MHVARAMIIGAALLCGLATPAASFAQAAKVYRVGFLGHGSDGSSASQVAIADFREGLRANGYAEGRNIIVDYRYGNVEQLRELAATLVRTPVDLIVALGDSAAAAARRATATVPIVITEYAGDPVKAGLATSFSRPGGNVTGLTTRNEELWGNRIGRLRELVPRINDVAVLWNPANPANASCVAELRSVAGSLKVELRTLEVSDAKALEAVFAALVREPPDALALCWDVVTLELAKSIGEFALKLRVPTVAAIREYVDAGALLSYGTDVAGQRRRAAYYVDKIRNGKKPSELPIEQAAAFDTVVNITTARRIGIVLPPYFMQTIEDRVE